MTFARVVVVTANNSYKIVTDSSTEADVGVHNLKMYITLVNYPLTSDLSHPTDLDSLFSITINHATCDCTLLKWTLPAAQSLTTSVKKAVSDTLTINMATVDQASKTTTPAIRRCYAAAVNTPCDETTSIRDVVDDSTSIFPTFMVRADKVITVNATSNTQSKTYTLRVNQ